MTKLTLEQREEAEEIIGLVEDEDALSEAIYKLIDERDTAHAEGVAEGAEQANAGKQEAWVLALQEGQHWRFISVPTHIKEGADRAHDPYSEHVVRILFDGPASVLAPKVKP